MLTVWGRRSSSNVQAVMWAIGELGLPFTRRDVGHTYGGNDTPEFLAMNPNGTVPVLRDGDGVPVWESGAILRCLATRYGPDDFWPADLARRTQVDQWAEWAKLNVALAFTGPVFWRVVRTPARERDPQAIRAATRALETKLAIAEQRLAVLPWLASEAFTLADIQFGHVLHRYYDIEIERTPLPALAAYYDRLTDRPAYREHVMVPYDELRAD
jgi:glutathione S-transferase